MWLTLPECPQKRRQRLAQLAYDMEMGRLSLSHLQENKVSEGERTMGFSHCIGCAGNCTGPATHLHGHDDGDNHHQPQGVDMNHVPRPLPPLAPSRRERSPSSGGVDAKVEDMGETGDQMNFVEFVYGDEEERDSLRQKIMVNLALMGGFGLIGIVILAVNGFLEI